jgi:hypothetical protein
MLAESFAGLTATDKHTMKDRSLVVLEWSIKQGCDPYGKLHQALSSLSRPRRAVSRRILLKCRPDLLTEYFCNVLQKRASAPDLARRFKNIEHWAAEAERLCMSWGVSQAPERVTGTLESLDTEWRSEAIAMCSAKRVASARDPWRKAAKIIQSFGLPLDEELRCALTKTIAPNQQTLSAVLQRKSAQPTAAAF